jgi:hypothetical protein
MTTIDLLKPVIFKQNPNAAFKDFSGSVNPKNIPNQIFSCRSCNNNLASSNPASQYQRLKLIQNTVRVYASLYMMNLAGLSAYQKPLDRYQQVEQAGAIYEVPPGINWNQMSDRASPSIQKVVTASGSTYRPSSTKNTIFRLQPGAMSPGGNGVDIKHNSYERYLNRLKGKGALRRGKVPKDFGAPLPFNPAFPVYGGKTVKTAIIESCDCPVENNNEKQNDYIYAPKSNAIQDQIYSVDYQFHIGDYVYSQKNNIDPTIYKAKIINIQDGIYTIQFVDDNSIEYVPISSLMIYFDCNCTPTPSLEENILYRQDTVQYNSSYFNVQNQFFCNLLGLATTSPLL